MSLRPGADLGGIRTLDDLRARCYVNDETGCWEWRGCVRKGQAVIWLPETRSAVSASRALSLLLGISLRPKQLLVPTCGDATCCNPDHRKVGSRSDLFRAVSPTRDPRWRAAIAHGKRRCDGKFSPELRARIISSTETCKAISAWSGVHYTQVSRIRRGEAWRDFASPFAGLLR